MYGHSAVAPCTTDVYEYIDETPQLLCTSTVHNCTYTKCTQLVCTSAQHCLKCIAIMYEYSTDITDSFFAQAQFHVCIAIMYEHIAKNQ